MLPCSPSRHQIKAYFLLPLLNFVFYFKLILLFCYSFPFLSGCILFFVRLFSLGTVLSVIGNWSLQSARKQRLEVYCDSLRVLLFYKIAYM